SGDDECPDDRRKNEGDDEDDRTNVEGKYGCHVRVRFGSVISGNLRRYRGGSAKAQVALEGPHEVGSLIPLLHHDEHFCTAGKGGSALADAGVEEDGGPVAFNLGLAGTARDLQ